MKYSLADLRYLMSRLRDPETGCPWDLEQDFASIVPHTLEEAYEVADTIERQDFAHLSDELGDLLFQVIFYSQLGEEQSLFTLDDVVHGIVEKLLRRHPHVFPQGTLHDRSELEGVDTVVVAANWEAIKQQERDANQKTGVLADIPLNLPALTRAQKLQKRAAQVGFDWNNAAQVLDKIEEETAELREAIAAGKQAEILDEMGDLLFAQVNLARHLGVQSEAALRSTNQKFERRFGYVEAQVASSGKGWDAYTLEELDHFWNEAKQQGL